MRSVPAGRLWAIAAMAVVGLGMMAVALAPLGPGARALTNCDVTAEEIALDGPEQELLRLLNEYRVANGIAPLAVSPNLNRAAAWYAKDMDEKQYFNMNHTDSLGRTPTQRFPDCGYPFGTRGENILGGTADPQVAFNLWKGSPGHNAAMLKTTFHAVGLGNSGIYWVMDFGGTDDSGEPTPTSLPTNTPTSTATSTPYVAPTATPYGQATNTPTPTPTLTPTATATPAPTMESADLPYGVSVPGVRR